MIRHVFKAASVIALLAGVTIPFLWLASERQAMWVDVYLSSTHRLACIADSGTGAVGIVPFHTSAARPIRWGRYSKPRRSLLGEMTWWRGGFGLAHSSSGDFVCCFPLWFASAFCVALAIGLWRAAGRAPPAGCCTSCGYDLRASAGRCPECGTPIAHDRHSEGRHTSR